MIDSSLIVQAGFEKFLGKLGLSVGLFHWMEEPFILCPYDKNQMLDLIVTLLYDLSDHGAGPLLWLLLFS